MFPCTSFRTAKSRNKSQAHHRAKSPRPSRWSARARRVLPNHISYHKTAQQVTDESSSKVTSSLAMVCKNSRISSNVGLKAAVGSQHCSIKIFIVCGSFVDRG